MPVEKKFGGRFTGTGRRRKRRHDFVYEVPLLASLELLLSDTFILDEVPL